MTNAEKKQLLMSYQDDYTKRTGEHIKFVSCSKWEAMSNFTDKVEFWTLVKMIFDFTGWKKDYVFNKERGSRQDARAFARSMIYFIAVNNGGSYNHCARMLNRDHATVIQAVGAFENRLDVEIHTKRFFYEVMEFIRENYYLYVDKNITEENLEEGT